MQSNPNWETLKRKDKNKLLQDNTDDDLAQSFLPPGMSKDEFKRKLTWERNFYRPDNISQIEIETNPPTKETTIGAWRDLSRLDALLELIDNSIDAWMRRRAKYPKYTANPLQVYIRVDEPNKTLEYEDNAGGVSRSKLINLVIPGFSETGDVERTIGSYKTGGKKAVFKLAEEATITTSYWNPVGPSDEAYEVQLDYRWLQDATDYDFPVLTLRHNPLERGQTVYKFRMRDDGISGATPWYANPDITNAMTKEIQRTYTLLLLRNPNIEIYFLNSLEPLKPLEDLYQFSGTNEQGTDLRPQRVIFKAQLPWKAKLEDIEIEIVLGCRTTTGMGQGEDNWGIDLYGNDRLFVHHDQEYFVEWFNLGTGQAGRLLRGFVNIKGPNLFVPWDTHKRHFNTEREVVTKILQKDKRIKEFFRQWNQAYSSISKLGKGQVSKTIRPKLKPWRVKKDLNIPFSSTIRISDKREKSLPEDIHKPQVASIVSAKSKSAITLRIQITESEFRTLTDKYDITGSSDDPDVIEELITKIKNAVLRTR